MASAIHKPEVKQIAELMLQEISTRLQAQEITLVVTEPFKDRLVEEGYSPSYGARPLRRVLMRLLEDTLAEAMLSGQIKAGATAVIDVDQQGVVRVEAAQPQPLLQAVA